MVDRAKFDHVKLIRLLILHIKLVLMLVRVVY